MLNVKCLVLNVDLPTTQIGISLTIRNRLLA